MIKGMRTLIKSVGMQRKYVFLLILRAPFDGISTLVHTLFLKEAYRSIELGDVGRLNTVCIIFGIAVCLMFCYNGMVWRAFGKMCAGINAKIKAIMMERIIGKPLESVEDMGHGGILTRFNQDAAMAASMLGGALNLPHFVIASINILLSSIILFGTKPQMFLLVWLFMIPHMFINRVAVANPSAKYQRRAQEATDKLTTTFESIINSAESMILFDAGEMMCNKYKHYCDEIFRARIAVVLRNALSNALIPLFGLGGYLLLIIYAGNHIVAGTMQFSELTGVLQLRGGVLIGGMMMINSFINLKVNSVGLRRMNEVINNTEGDSATPHTTSIQYTE